MAGTTRKPHNMNAGYVCELKSKHPKLPGHFVIYDRNADPGPDIDADYRWVLMHEPSSHFVSVETLASARALMKQMAAGSDAADFGQHDIGKEGSLHPAPKYTTRKFGGGPLGPIWEVVNPDGTVSEAMGGDGGKHRAEQRAAELNRV